MKRILLITMVILSALSASSAEGVPYYKGTVYEALSAASKQRKMLIVEFYADWNYKSRWMNENVISKKEVYDAIDKSFVIVKVETKTTEGAKLAEVYKVTDYPTLVVFNQNGNVVDKIDKALDKPDFISRLEQILIENDGKSSLELSRIFDEASNDNSTLADQLTQKYLSRVGVERAITPYHWDLFSNNSIMFYGSSTFDYVVENREKFNSTFGKIEVDNLLNNALIDAITPYSIGAFEYDSVFITEFKTVTATLNTTYTPTHLQLAELAVIRAQKNIDEYIIAIENLVKILSAPLGTQLMTTMGFIVEEGNREQKKAASRIIEKYGRFSTSRADLEIIEALNRKLSE